MILNTQDILNSPRCEPWTDYKTTEFMDLDPFDSPGNKTIQNFLDSEGILDIKIDEIFWVIINCMGNDRLLNICIFYLELYASSNRPTFGSIFIQLYEILNNSENKLENIDKLLDTIQYKMDVEFNIHKDVTNSIKFYKLVILLLTDIKNNSNLVSITKKISNMLVSNFPNENNYRSLIMNIISLYE